MVGVAFPKRGFLNKIFLMSSTAFNHNIKNVKTASCDDSRLLLHPVGFGVTFPSEEKGFKI